MPVTRENPYGRFNFLVEIEGVEAGGFTEVEGLSGTIEPIEYREGSDRKGSFRTLPGLVKHSPVTLRHGFAGNGALFEWWKAVRDGAPERRTVAVVLLDERREPVARWTLLNAWPTKYEGPAFNARTSEVAIESIEIVHEGLELE